MEWLLAAIHGDRATFDALWYAAFPPDPWNGECDVDAILGNDRQT